MAGSLYLALLIVGLSSAELLTGARDEGGPSLRGAGMGGVSIGVLVLLTASAVRRRRDRVADLPPGEDHQPFPIGRVLTHALLATLAWMLVGLLVDVLGGRGALAASVTASLVGFARLPTLAVFAAALIASAVAAALADREFRIDPI